MKVISWVIFYLFVIPVSILTHEIGHALGLIISTKNGIAKVYLGRWSNSEKETVRIGRISLYIKWGYSGYCSYTIKNGEVKKSQAILFMMGGPFISLIVSIGLFIIFLSDSTNYDFNNIFMASAAFNFFQFLFTIIPIVYPSWLKPYEGKQSDGYQILRILKGN